MNDMQRMMLDIEAQRKLEAKEAYDVLQYRLGMVDEKNRTLEKLVYERNLIEFDIIRYIRDIFSNRVHNVFCFISSEFVQRAWEGSGKKGRKCDELKSILKEMDRHFFSSKVKHKFVQMTSVNWGESYDFTYKIGKDLIVIRVPMFKKVSDRTYREMIKGYIVYIEENGNTYNQIFSSINPDEVKEFLTKRYDVGV